MFTCKWTIIYLISFWCLWWCVYCVVYGSCVAINKFYLEHCRELLLTELQPTSIIPGILQILIYGYNKTLLCKCISVKLPWISSMGTSQSWINLLSYTSKMWRTEELLNNSPSVSPYVLAYFVISSFRVCGSLVSWRKSNKEKEVMEHLEDSVTQPL